MPISIGIITARQSMDNIRQTEQSMKQHCKISYFPYDTLDELRHQYTKAAAKSDGLLFSGPGLCVRAGGAPSGDDALAMSICRVTKSDIRIPYLASDLLVLALSLSYLDLKRIAVSLLTVVLSGQLIGFVQNARVPQAEG